MTGSLIEQIATKRSGLPAGRAMLVGVSGIDASGKGYVTARIAEALNGLSVAVINVDGWLNLPDIRFDSEGPAENFYDNGLRLDEMFERLVLPLKQNREIDLTMDYAEETATAFRPHRYAFNEIDIILLEGIFLFKKQYAKHFDLKIWIDCSFKTAMQRAIARSQEGLNAEETVFAYETIYFPAQQLHFLRDDPHSDADVIISND